MPLYWMNLVVQTALTMLDLMERLVGSLDEAADASELQEENGIYRIAGNCELERMEETLRMQLPETDATTAGGWIVEQLVRIPHTGETLLLHGYQFQIEKAAVEADSVCGVAENSSTFRGFAFSIWN